jgi:hypothetical protein
LAEVGGGVVGCVVVGGVVGCVVGGEVGGVVGGEVGGGTGREVGVGVGARGLVVGVGATFTGPWETSNTTVLLAGTAAPAGGVVLITMPAGTLECSCVKDFTGKPNALRVALAWAMVCPDTFGITGEEEPSAAVSTTRVPAATLEPAAGDWVRIVPGRPEPGTVDTLDFSPALSKRVTAAAWGRPTSCGTATLAVPLTVVTFAGTDDEE